MPLTIIKGPPNSGRTEEVRREYIDLLPRRPVLVVPSVDDIFDWESRLARDRGAFLGNRIVHFKDLVSDILGRDPGSLPRVATALERRHLVSIAMVEAWPALKSRVARQPGLVDAMLRLIDEFRQALLDPETIEENSAEIDSGYLESIIAVYRHYLAGLDSRGLTDNPALAVEATSTNLSAWQGRPIYVAGFDDLTKQQLELLARLGAQTDVTIALTHEVGNPAMAVTENLLGRLEARGAEVRLTTDRGSSTEPQAHTRELLEVERDFMRQPVARSLDPEPGSVTVMHSSGQRGEAEGVSGRIARLVADGVPPDEIAIAVASPATDGRRFREALQEYDLPVTLESETPATETAIGRSVLALLAAASPGGTAADFIRYLRGPTGSDTDAVDRLEYMMVRAGAMSARAAAEAFSSDGEASPPGWDALAALKRGEAAAGAIGLACRQMAEVVLATDHSGLPGDSTVTEVQMAKAISNACEELESIGGGAGIVDIAEALRSGAVKTWAIPTQGTVRIASPYSLRAKRFRHLFMVSLQESAFNGADRSGPFLNSDARRTVGLPDFMDQELQELYLFYSCLSVPTAGLWLSCRVADDSGKAEHPSPLVAEVENLFPKGSLRRHGRSAEQIVFSPSEAPSRSELVRALATLTDPVEVLEEDQLGLSPGDNKAFASRLAVARETEIDTRTLGSLRAPASLEALAEDLVFSATSLEAFRTCPYQWFIEKALRPQRFGPEPEAMANGSLVHAVLKEIFDEGEGRLPDESSISDWKARVEPTVERLAGSERFGLGSDSAAHRVIRRKAINVISAYLEREAQRDSAFQPFATEAGFGMNDDPVDMDGWWLRGSIDRIDRSGADGIVFDYKTGKGGVLTRAKILEQKKLQLQLYMAVLERRWKLNPVAALYVPVLRGDKLAPRGFVDSEAKEDLKDLGCVSRDLKGDFRAEIDQAVADATATVGEILAGNIGHDPLSCFDHLNHAAVPDWAPDTKPEESWGSGG